MTDIKEECGCPSCEGFTKFISCLKCRQVVHCDDVCECGAELVPSQCYTCSMKQVGIAKRVFLDDMSSDQINLFNKYEQKLDHFNFLERLKKSKRLKGG